jgi:hypothetical protein
VAAETVFQGSLFSNDFLEKSIESLPDWQRLSDPEIDTLADDLREIFSNFPITQNLMKARQRMT